MDTQSRKAVFLDCDPGHDDAFAILLACYTEMFTVLGISTIGGNQTVEKTTNNALRILELIGKSNSTISVVKGVLQPLARPPMVCPEIHGDTGLDLRPGCTLKVPDATQQPITDKPAIQFMWESISKYYNENNGEKVTIVATGPLTNVALLFLVYPQVKPMVDVSILGGSINFGNISPASEYNILVDPEGAKVVFESGVPITMVPLDVSHMALVNKEVIDRIAALKKEGDTNQFIDIIIELLLYFSDNYKLIFDFEHPPLHDPLAVAYLIDPSIFTSRLLRVDVETSSNLCLGRTVVDLFNFSKLEKNVNVCTNIKIEKFWDMLIHAIDNCYNNLRNKK
ncbi:hypothetical protein DICPUDRAFT_56928 [Dictyostelium purpureum]|uniref:Inosine/uridine-preferring nucleoside hydrolase domain-containing protein n=1 Tax=Dictyostelium purpureum TaxID=5786 RepID=F0ZTN3_DICPU|nr:uncharacterized protein DICPUDRAFT_56928 [Dictyostelium purpureum]EGC32708.1 hypothetical protein DICPUDRAFT_56928 [Dictyostelium purpureum]|eukprot:XP_003290777.1 hypothetical protein DICPUDRAFT_56928 [Dictyostelium purpureum]